MAFSKARRLANLMSSASDTVPASKVNTVLADDAVTSPKIADDAVTTDKLANSINTAITANTAKVTNAITTHTGDVTGAAALTIAANAVTIGKLAVTDGSNGQVLTTNGSGTLSFATVSAGAATGTSLPSVTAVGTQFYNTSTKALYSSDGSAWVLIAQANALPVGAGGTVTMATVNVGSAFTHNLGLQFSDADSVDSLLTYTLHSGTLPAGLTMPAFGTTSLTGTASGNTATYTFVIKATDLDGGVGTQAYQVGVSNDYISATGGTITTTGGYKYHTFTSSGNFIVSGRNNRTLDALIVAGGGAAGGSAGGGGGAGGAIEDNNITPNVATYAIVIGGGAVQTNAATQAQQGNNTTCFGNTALGGGGGSGTHHVSPYNYKNATLQSGGSGGGGFGWDNPNTGGPKYDLVGGTGTSGQGNDGGDAPWQSYYGCGGGGKGAAGANADITLNGAAGGVGINWKSLGTFYAGGGGGGAEGTGGLGGNGGGGDGVTNGGRNGYARGFAGTANTGGGGGGGFQFQVNGGQGGGAGGSGVVIIRYAV